MYDPAACGPLQSVEVSYSLQNRGSDLPPFQNVNFAIRQGGHTYWSFRSSTVMARVWSSVSQVGLGQNEFYDYVAFSLSKPAGKLDFSGSPLEFGYVTVNSCGVGSGTSACAQEETTSALGVWHVTLHR